MTAGAADLGARGIPTADSPVTQLAPIREALDSQRNGTAGGTATSWAPVDLAPVLAGDNLDPPPTLLARTDGPCLLYPERVTLTMGEPEACKGWFVTHACSGVLAEGGIVAYVDFEDSANAIVARLLALGTSPEAIASRLLYVRPDEPLTLKGPSRAAFDSIVAAAPTIAIFDGLTEALALHGLDLLSNTDIATWRKLAPRPLAQTGSAVVEIDHVMKNRENRGRYAIGAQHKLAGADVAYALDVIEPFGRGRQGKVKITVAKDRPGHVRAHQADGGRIALMVLDSHDDGGVTVTLNPPEHMGEAFRPTYLMERLSRAIEEQPGLSKRGLREAVKGKNPAKDLALEILVAEGYVAARREGIADRHYSSNPYRETAAETADRAPVPRPCPDRAPAQSRTTVPPCPSLEGTGRGTNEGTTKPGDRAPRLEQQ